MPAFNTITYALELDYQNVTVTPNSSANNSSQNDSLKLNGYTATPYLAISLRNIGLGFSAETAHHDITYGDLYSPASSENQKSTLNYNALGVYLYLIPVPTMTYALTTIILGGKTYTATQIEGGFSEVTSGQPQYQPETQTYHYTVDQFEVGLNVSIPLLKNFILIPWLDERVTNTSQIASQAATASNDLPLKDDTQLFWHSAPSFTYGLDFAVRIERFQVHLGSLLGTVADPQHADGIVDKSLSLSLSLDQKGS